MKKKEVTDRASRLKMRAEVRSKNMSDYFFNFSKWHRLWMKNLANRYKARGEFPTLPVVLLPSYYESMQDREVAAFVALLIKDDGGGCQDILHHMSCVQAFHDMIGESPHRWFYNREFVRLSVGSMRDKRTGGIENWKIARLMDRLWFECFGKGRKRKSIQECVARIANKQHCSYFEVLTYLLEGCSVGNFFYKLRLLLMVLCDDEGIGLSIWHDSTGEYLRCPLAKGIRQFVMTWFPDYKISMDAERAIQLFGFERESDFLYAFWGYRELQKRNPKECSLYATRVQTWYEFGSQMKRNRWIGIQPEIPF